MPPSPPVTEAPHPIPKRGERLGLVPPGDTGDLLVEDLLGAMAVRLTDGSACFVLITTKGLRHAPANPFNRAILLALVSTISALPALGEPAQAEQFESFLAEPKDADAPAGASLVHDAHDQPWLIVFARDKAAAFELSDERWDSLLAEGYKIEVKSEASFTRGLRM